MGSARLYQCMYCGMSFPHQSKLTRHILSHSLESLKYRELQHHHLAMGGLGDPGLHLMESHFSGRPFPAPHDIKTGNCLVFSYGKILACIYKNSHNPYKRYGADKSADELLS